MLLLHDFLEYLPFVAAFSAPMMPVGDAPAAPSVSADAERKRQAAADAAQADMVAGGRSSTIHAGTGIAYDEQRSLMRGSASRSLGL